MQTLIGRRRPGVLTAFCILHCALLISACAKRAPATPVPARTALEQLSSDILQATRLPGVQRGVWGIVVHSLDRDERLFALNREALLVPASVAKIASVATAADAVGWDYRFETTVAATGPVVDGVLRGDLLVVGSGDPSIGGRAAAAPAGDAGAPDEVASWIEALKAAGIHRIDGRVIGDDDSIEEPRPQLAWAWDDLGYTAGALFGALNFAENRMTVTVDGGPAPGAPATITVEAHAVHRPLGNRVSTGAAGSLALVWPEQRPGEPFLTIAGSVPAGTGGIRLNVSAGNPTFWFASALRSRLQRGGIEVSGEAWDVDDVVPRPERRAATVLITHRSRPLRDLVQPLLKDSINLYAEAVMRLNASRDALATNDAALEGFRRRMEAWGVPGDAQQLIDGSGLSRRNAISADAVLTLLKRAHEPAWGAPLVAGLPVAGVDGSLANRMRGTRAEGNVRAKTGTMSNIRTLAGYVTTRDGERLAFVAMVNNFEGAGATANQALDAIAIALASFSR